VDTWNRIYSRNEFPHVQTTPQQARTLATEMRAALREHYEQDGRLLASMLGTVPPWLSEAPSIAPAEASEVGA